MAHRSVTTHGQAGNADAGREILLADFDERWLLTDGAVPILDADLLDDDGFEPDGVNDFVRDLAPRYHDDA